MEKLYQNQKIGKEALKILKSLNDKTHYLISSVCISKNGGMIWNYTDKAALTMKNMSNEDLENIYLKLVMMICMLTMFTKLKELVEFIFKY